MTTPEWPVVDAAPAPETAATRPSARRRGLLLTAAVVVSTLVGAGAATAVLFALRPPAPEHGFAVNVYLKADSTAAQKAAIQAALPAFHPTGGVRFETREQAWQKMTEMAKDEPGALRNMKQQDMPESFHLETRGRLFDCTGFTKVRHLPGVAQVQVLQRPMNGYAATITCDAEYATP